MTLPSFLIIGAEKAGTTWLHDVLGQHPAVVLPDVKELHFFNDQTSNLAPNDRFHRSGPEWYAAQFARCAEAQQTGEATPLYLPDPAAPARAAALLPNAQILILLRNPITRAVSHYRMAHAKGHLTDSFSDAIDRADPRLLDRGQYARQIARWLKVYPRHQIHVTLFETLRDPAALGAIAKFLRLDPDGFAAPEAAERNAATGYRSAALYNLSVRTARAARAFPPTRRLAERLKSTGVYAQLKRANMRPAEPFMLSPADRARLSAYFEEDVAALRRLLPDLPLPWPEFAPARACA